MAVMIAKGIEKFPGNSDRMTGTIDVWWIVRILLRVEMMQFVHKTVAVEFSLVCLIWLELRSTVIDLKVLFLAHFTVLKQHHQYCTSFLRL
jgi:hypothetical protein